MNIRSFLFALLMLVSMSAAAERIKDIATVLGVRENQLIGYGLVVGLDGSGDMTMQTPFTVQSITNMLLQMGVNMPPGSSSIMMLKNVAAVTVTASLPPFSRPGQTIDITVSSIGNAKSLRGGTLLMTPLKGADGQVYAMAQGNMLVSGAGAAAAGSKTQVNHLSVGRIPGGATVERSVPTALGQGEYVYLELNNADFTTAMRLAEAIDHNLAPVQGIAMAVDARTIQIKAPEGGARVAFISQIENLDVDVAAGSAKVIVNARTGSVVMNQHVSLDDCAVAHGNLTVVVNAENTVSQPAPLSQGQTAAVTNATIEINADKGNLLRLKRGVDLNDVVKALNSIGVTPQDMLAILQAMKSAGALHADLEVI
ncbi:flagellar P-ring protein [Sideroxyarcus emersonii]|uniref:Flagellar P-ring protein n=1 Tax=Sideroxyarcus emersonii TaxID=2764705 RepID=A0AAN2BY18_9PROT|nr:flagellar basal body P-ring protein FlgI [Sideroxyarcus emersonii]BCK86695.1 flagellar P-ring protein [Sideroxyarcus emersonii]